MTEGAIASQALAHAGLRALPTEHGGPRPAGTRADTLVHEAAGASAARATRP